VSSRSAGLSRPALVRSALGGALIGAGARRSGLAGLLFRAAGSALAAASVAPAAGRALRKASERRRWVDRRRIFFVGRPLDEVFGFFRNFENFESMLTDVESVVDHDDGRSRWTLKGRGRRRLVWDAYVTKWVPGSVIAWENVPSSEVESAGLIRFSPAVQQGVEGTCVDISFRYRPKLQGWAEMAEGLIRPRPPRRVARDFQRLPQTVHQGTGGAKLAKLPLPEEHSS
jgi:uncharacterized membrane protein